MARFRLSRMRRMAFVHLRAHTEFSVVDGTLRIDDAVAAAAADGQGALAITDLSNLFGAVKFFTAARRAGVKPIIGAEVCMAAEPGEKQTSRLVLLVRFAFSSSSPVRANSSRGLRRRAFSPQP